MRVLLSGDVPDAHLEVSVVVGLDEGVDGAHDALLVAVVMVVVVRSTHRKAVSAKTLSKEIGRRKTKMTRIFMTCI